MITKSTTRIFIAGLVAGLIVGSSAVLLGTVGLRILPITERLVQVLRSSDAQHSAELRRIEGLDVNFLVFLNGKRVHRSHDCSPNKSIPFRETLAWDNTGKILVLQLAGRTVFAVDVHSGQEVHSRDFGTIKLPKVTLKDIGFEGLDKF